MRNRLDIESKAIKEFYERRDSFWKKVDPQEKKTLNMIDDFIQGTPQAMSSMNITVVMDLETHLAVTLDTLGEFMAKAETEFLAVKDYIEEKFADEFSPTKTLLESQKGKILKAEVETHIEARYREEKWLMRLLEERWKIYKAKVFSGDRILDSIKNRIIQLRRMEQLANVQARGTTNYEPQ